MGRVTGECREWVLSVELYIGLMVNFCRVNGGCRDGCSPWS